MLFFFSRHCCFICAAKGGLWQPLLWHGHFFPQNPTTPLLPGFKKEATFWGTCTPCKSINSDKSTQKRTLHIYNWILNTNLLTIVDKRWTTPPPQIPMLFPPHRTPSAGRRQYCSLAGSHRSVVILLVTDVAAVLGSFFYWLPRTRCIKLDVGESDVAGGDVASSFIFMFNGLIRFWLICLIFFTHITV